MSAADGRYEMEGGLPMTLGIDLTPQETAWRDAEAERQGLLPAEII